MSFTQLTERAWGPLAQVFLPVRGFLVPLALSGVVEVGTDAMPPSNTMLHRGVCGLLIPGLRQLAPHVTHFILCISVQLNKANHVMSCHVIAVTCGKRACTRMQACR
jgi:hypothetical protein